MRKWVRPSAYEECFASNENIANSVNACIVGVIQCQYPGNGDPMRGGTNGKAEFDDYNGSQSGWYYDSAGNPHGICGYNADISFAGATGSGYEKNNGVTDTNRRIYDISGYAAEKGTYYNVTWKSMHAIEKVEYTHKGRLVINQIDTSRPNHS